MNNKQLTQAIQMYDSGITWSVIAAYFKIDQKTLRRRIRKYEQEVQLTQQ
ncbi:helix-turn-helix domain-containing protein [Synechococcus sp. KORDI-100]